MPRFSTEDRDKQALQPRRRLRILFVTPYVPSSIRVRSRTLLTKLAERGHEVSLVCQGGPGDQADLDAIRRRSVDAVAVPRRLGQTALAYLRAIPAGMPLQAVHCLSEEFTAAVRTAVAHRDFDIIHIEHLRAAEVVRTALRGRAGRPPLIMDSVDSISLLFERIVRKHPSPVHRALALFELGRTRRFEASYFNSMDAVTVVSAEDAWAFNTLRERFGTHGSAAVRVVPQGVDLGYFAPAPVERDAKTIVFSGNMRYHANQAAALFLCREIMPLVWRHDSEVRVVLAGANPPRSLRSLAGDPRITVTGRVDDLRPFLARATMAVAAIRYGAGVQIKVLEAMAMGTPVVAARQASVALAACPGSDLLVAEDAAGFAEHIRHLLASSTARASLGAAGRAYVERHHNWSSSVARLEACYAEAMATSGSAAGEA